MRTVTIAIFDATAEQVSARLMEYGCERVPERYAGWNYPAGSSAVLYMSCVPYDLDREFPEEHAELLNATAGRGPQAWVHIDVSGRVPGTTEVHFVLDALLAHFAGVAFDDWTSFDHAWTLEEIQSHALVDGCAFFDYVGRHQQSKRAPN